jgi:hypothetical protein
MLPPVIKKAALVRHDWQQKNTIKVRVAELQTAASKKTEVTIATAH